MLEPKVPVRVPVHPMLQCPHNGYILRSVQQACRACDSAARVSKLVDHEDLKAVKHTCLPQLGPSPFTACNRADSLLQCNPLNACVRLLVRVSQVYDAYATPGRPLTYYHRAVSLHSPLNLSASYALSVTSRDTLLPRKLQMSILKHVHAFWKAHGSIYKE